MGILKLSMFAVAAGMIGVFVIEPVAGFWVGVVAFSAVCGFAYGALTSKRGDE